MSKCKKSQIIILTLLALLLFATPFIPSSSRPKYLYVVINILIIALGAEAGLISSFSNKPSEDKKIATNYSNTEAATNGNESIKKVRVVEKSRSEKIVTPRAKAEKVKKCPSMPSLFFIGGGGDHQLEALEDVAEDYNNNNNDNNNNNYREELVEMEEFGGDVGGHEELFTKAEMFIGNFYKQLKMQREDSWKRIHGFYQKGF